MNRLEASVSLLLSAVFGLRMLGLFMLLPVLMVYADTLEESTPVLMGLAMGAYGITQALWQIPAGLLSNRIGRKPVIIIGFGIFFLGGLIAAFSGSMYGIIAGRFVQGGGAGAAITALLSDLTREQSRTRVMAMVGRSIGIAFCIAVVLGPLITRIMGLGGLFMVSALAALTAMIIVAWGVPTPAIQKCCRETATITGQITSILKDLQLLRLDAGVFILHFILMGLFITVPLALQNFAGLAREQHWWVYLLTMVLSFVATVPLISVSKRKHWLKQMMVGAVTLLLIAQGVVWSERASLVGLLISLFLFFAAFHFLEATLPFLVSCQAQAGSGGTAMGVYSTGQFLGAGLGGVLCGVAYQAFGHIGVLSLCGVVTGIWWLLVMTMHPPRYVSSLVLGLFPVVPAEAGRVHEQISSVLGVKEVMLIVEEQTAYLKVDKQSLDRQRLRQFGEW